MSFDIYFIVKRKKKIKQTKIRSLFFNFNIFFVLFCMQL